MNDITRILNELKSGSANADDRLLPLIYAELRAIAAAKVSHEKPGATIQATALVHEAWLRLVGPTNDDWSHRGHFFAAAAEAMRRILIEAARKRSAQKRGGNLHRAEFCETMIESPATSEHVLAVHEALDRLAENHPLAAQIVKLRYFVGMSNAEAASAAAVSPRKANQLWAFARVWLSAEIGVEPNVADS